MAKHLKDDQYYVKKTDLEGIRERPQMYAGSIGDMGCLHCIKEMVDNNRDEGVKTKKPGYKIIVKATSKEITTSDNGRGISVLPLPDPPPGRETHSALQVIHETNHAGSNTERAGGNTSGENGTGTAVYTALASKLILTTLRPSEKKKLTLTYKEGELVDEKLEDYNGAESGMTTTYRPSMKILAVDELPLDLLLDYLKTFDYSLPRRIAMDYNIGGVQYSVIHKELYKYYDEHIDPDKRLCEAVVVHCNGDVMEPVKGKLKPKKFNIETAIMYSSAEHRGANIRQSWMNCIWTTLNGAHVNGVIDGIQKFLIERAIKKSPKLKEEDIKFLERDVLSHLHICVKGECDMENMFSGQSKAEMPSTGSGRILRKAIKKSIYEAMEKLNKSTIEELVDIVIANNRVRKAGEEMRNVNSNTKALKKWQKPDEYLMCNSDYPISQRELYLVEGRSAGGGLRAAKNNWQAILCARGKNLNVWDLSINDIIGDHVKSAVWRNLVRICGCGIGPTFDLDKLQFSKIIICTDADIDGYHIRTGYLAFFYKYWKPIIDAGKLYIAEPPLYKLENKKNISYVASQPEYVQECIKSVSDIKVEFLEMGS
jgi:DNA gyrase subunit B